MTLLIDPHAQQRVGDIPGGARGRSIRVTSGVAQSSPVLWRYDAGGSRSGWTFTNASANGVPSQVGSGGLVSFVNTNVARDANYIGGVRTLLLESSRTDSLTWSRDLTNVAWTKRGTAAVAKTATGADGVANSASAITGLGANGTNDIFFTPFTVASGARIEPSCYLQKVTSSGTVKLFNAQNVANGEWSLNLALLGSGWERITRSHPAVTVVIDFIGTTGNLAGLLFACSAGAPVAINVDLVQFEPGSTSSSPIPTTTTALTRAVDALSIAGLTTGTATLFYRYWDLATSAWVNAAAAYVSGAPIVPPVDRAYKTIAVLSGTYTAAAAAALLGL